VLERAIELMEREFDNVDISHLHFPLRYLCIKLLEGDKEIEEMIDRLPKCDEIRARRDKERAYIEKLLREDAESAFTNARYGFIEGALKETFTEKTNIHDTTRILDAIVTNKYIGLPIFFLFMWLMFEATFRLGEYPMQGIEWLVETGRQFRSFAHGRRSVERPSCRWHHWRGGRGNRFSTQHRHSLSVHRLYGRFGLYGAGGFHHG